MRSFNISLCFIYVLCVISVQPKAFSESSQDAGGGINKDDNIGDFDSQLKARKLIFSHILFRHGDRAPIMTYPTDPYGDQSFWEVDWGQLTNIGKQQQYNLGRWLRVRYGNHLLPEEYNDNDIYIHSTDANRTLESAYSNLAGLFPSKDNNQIWHLDLLKQLIPVHTIPHEQDYIIGGEIPSCPSYQRAKAELYESPMFIKINDQAKPLYDYLTDHSGFPVNKSVAMASMYSLLIRDTLFCEHSHGFALPEWTKRIFPNGKEIDTIALLYYVLPSYTPALAKIRSGYLFKEILNRSQEKFDGALIPNRSAWIYSAHDSVLASILHSLKLFDNQLIQYAACILFELISTEHGPELEIYYKESNDSDVARQLFIPNCGWSCSLDILNILYRDILPTEDFDTACK